jgi:hypothetical protein
VKRMTCGAGNSTPKASWEPARTRFAFERRSRDERSRSCSTSAAHSGGACHRERPACGSLHRNFRRCSPPREVMTNYAAINIPRQPRLDRCRIVAASPEHRCAPGRVRPCRAGQDLELADRRPAVAAAEFADRRPAVAATPPPMSPALQSPSRSGCDGWLIDETTSPGIRYTSDEALPRRS